jgi:hypothetical protein
VELKVHVRALMEIGLERVGIADAVAMVCVGDDDVVKSGNRFVGTKAQRKNRVAARLANNVVHEAISADHGRSAVLNVAELTAHRSSKRAAIHARHAPVHCDDLVPGSAVFTR